MSLSDTLKATLLLGLHATVTALHADLANKLAAGGVDASPDDHVDNLTAKAAAAGTASPQTPPNYADHALATFHTGLAAALAAFATAHLPAKFLPAAAQAVSAIDDALDGNPAATSEAVHDAVAAGVAVAGALNPIAGVAVSIAAPIIENIADEVIAKHEAGETLPAEPVAPAPVVSTESPIEPAPVAAATPVVDWGN